MPGLGHLDANDDLTGKLALFIFLPKPLRGAGVTDLRQERFT
jgi:hypothetical protein